ncbi:hypothetical protein BDV29DRAFT_125796 [Aspergillus leporis]|uniref:Uncharacterized protein n=1 Tax=Aspergillus leporis TaxID=41062 RepID=A0A5N5X049_9EURO|nr:hypothetical protein BDV29DRAFT_125796 [Aspergillus leporis]
MAGDKPEVTEIGTVMSPVATKPSFMSRVAAHYKKWWWAHLIGVIVVVLVITLPLVYVGYPNIAQENIDDSTLEIKSMVISDPAPSSFQLNQTQVLGTHSIFHPNIYAFDATVSLLGAAVPFSTVRVPQVKSNDGVEVPVNQRVELSDVSAFGDFATAVMLNEEIKLNIYGKPDLKQGGLPRISVTYNKTVTMKGLNKLHGFKLSGMHLTKTASDGTNTEGQVLIPNPSVLTIDLGNVTLGLSVNGTSIGESYINDLVLKPGDNTLAMRAKVDQLTVLSVAKNYKDMVVPLEVTGSDNSSVYNGQVLSYFSKALSSNKLAVDLNITEVIGIK